MALEPTQHDAGTRIAMACAGIAGSDSDRRIGQYRILQKLGAGGMGVVFKVQHLVLEKTFALKLLALKNMCDSGLLERFQKEMKALGKVRHAHIVAATDAGAHEGYPYLVMEHVEGSDLIAILHAGKVLRVEQICAIVRQIALGLQDIADHGLVHRDIKPSNIMLTQAGQVKILDLGLALLKEEDAAPGEALTSPGTAMGTFDYIAPEQTIDAHYVDIRADIYSLGCTFYKLLAGRAPFEDESYHSRDDKSRAHRDTAVPDISTFRPDLPPEVQAILAKLLAKHPDDRYQTPLEVAAALAPYSSERGLADLVPAPPGAAAYVTTEKDSAPLAGDTKLKKPSTHEVARPATALKSRRWGRKRIALCSSALALALVALVPVIIVRPTEAEGPMESGKWYSLLKRPPKPIEWSDFLQKPIWDKNREQLTLIGFGDIGYLGLGKTELGKTYRLQVMVHQPGWQGKFSIFFGMREEKHDDGIHRICQEIELTQETNQPYSHLWRRIKMTRRPDANLTSSSEGVASHPLQTIGQGEHVLEFLVGPQSLAKAYWAGQELTGLCRVDAHYKFSKQDYAGEFGVSLINTSVVFRDARIMYLER